MMSPMSTSELAKCLTILEAEVEKLKRQGKSTGAKQPWWRQIAGQFANDSMYEEAMRLGREYRESLRPKSSERASRRGLPVQQ